MSLFQTPQLDREDSLVLDEIHRVRDELSDTLRTPRRWTGKLRRHNEARAIRGSNSIEGYNVDLDDAIAAVEDERPLSADEETFVEIMGYRLALGYVLATADDPTATIDHSTVRTMHYMMLSHDLSKSPGRYREREIFVHDEKTDEIAYIGPQGEDVNALMAEFVDPLGTTHSGDPFIDAAMAHLNLVMIHPFRDGNGRMARCLQTLVLARRGVTEPLFSSIEEWLGRNTDDYYKALSVVGQGAWHPENDASLWLKFCLRAHHMQGQTQLRRIQWAIRLGDEATQLIEDMGLPERTFDALYEAMVGLKVRRHRYVDSTQIDQRTATRDLTELSRAGLLVPRSQTRGRYYVAGDELRRRAMSARRGLPGLSDPCPGFIEALRARETPNPLAGNAPT